jgi:hypothetical protein
MEFVETPIFTKKIRELLQDDDYMSLQTHLSANPDAGTVIPQSGGIRKIRWASGGKGKRGGLRVIYFHITRDNEVYMLYAYTKNTQEDLTNEQLKLFKALVTEELK